MHKYLILNEQSLALQNDLGEVKNLLFDPTSHVIMFDSIFFDDWI